MILNIVLNVIIVVVCAILIAGCFYTVDQQSAAIIERFGRYQRTAQPGLNVKIPLVDRVASRIDLHIRQLDIEVETKTRDNVFTTLSVAVQFQVLADRVVDAFYQLSDPDEQIEAYVFDAVRAKVPSMSLAEVFENKDAIAGEVSADLSQAMSGYGFAVTRALVTDIAPDETVKRSMNAVYAAQREQDAAEAQGEAKKILTVKRAEAEAESKRLQGEGIAAERSAIVDGLRNQLSEMSDGTNVSEEDALAVLMTTQYFDTLARLGAAGATTILLPGGASAATSIGEEIRNAVVSGYLATEGTR